MTSVMLMENTINNNNNNITKDNNEIANGEVNREHYLRELTKTFTGIEKPLKNAPTCATLTDLISALHEAFASDRVNIEVVNHLLLSYQSNPSEWRKFAKFDRFR